MALYVLYNDFSGNGRAKELIARCQASYPQFDYRLFPTQVVNDEREQVARILQTFQPQLDQLLIVGGDGTLSKTLKAWPSDFPFAYLPAGSGNDFSRSLGKLTMAQVFSALLSHSPKPINVLKSSNEVIVNSLDAAYAARTVALAERGRLKKYLNALHLGDLVYPLLGIFALFQRPVVSVSVKIGGQELALTNLFFLSLANSCYFGGGITIWPDSHLTRSNLHLVYAPDRGLLGNLATLLSLLTTRHQQSPYLKAIEGTELVLTFEEETLVQIDGDCHQLNSIAVVCQTRYLYY